ncbi:hypothetical protein [Curtobacterium sp. MCPF17_031]|uniref:hypothetical protein n=1 Tax=Curtobacterium sp. MCPF17_031 TaxID=2175653 RepID=UPI0011B5E3B9|nr:hypothetical protein [Curtobacterium sp. MCPF17_031]
MSSRDEDGTFPVSNDRFGELLLWEQDRAATIVVMNDAGTTRTAVPDFPDVRAIADQHDDDDEGDAAVDRALQDRRDAFTAAVHTDVIGSVVVVLDTADGFAVGAGRYTEDGWVTTMNSYGGQPADIIGLTVLLAPAE